MVLKGTKRSLRTGNTLRTRDIQTNKRAGSVIVRHSTNFSRRQVTDVADDSFLTADAVEFSLNKKGRWNLPEVIEENICHDDLVRGGDIKVSMLRRHRLNRQNDCLGVVTSGSGGDDRCHVYTTPQRKKARRKTYCNGLNVLHSGRGKSTKDPKKKQVVSTSKQKAQRQQDIASSTTAHELTEPIQPSPQPTPEVRYDVFYPVPTSSSLRFHPKFAAGATGPVADIEQRLVAMSSGSRHNRGSNQRHRHVDYYDDVYSDYDFDDWGYDEEEDDADFGEDCKHFYEEDPGEDTVLLSDVVETALVMSLSSAENPASLRRSRRPRSFRQARERFFYHPEIEDDFDSCLEDARSEVSTESESSTTVTSSQRSVLTTQPMTGVTISMSTDATSRDVLAEKYGPSYSEAACSPRKVVIDITDRVQEALRGVSSFSDMHLPLLDLTSYAVFTYICPDTAQTNQPEDNCPGSARVAGPTDQAVEQMSEDSTVVQHYDVFRVQLNMNCLGHGLDLRLPHGSLRFDSVDDVLRQVLDFTTTLTPERLARQASEASPCWLESRLKPDFHTVSEVNGWTVSCVSLLDVESGRCLPSITRNDGLLASVDTDGGDVELDDAKSGADLPDSSCGTNSKDTAVAGASEVNYCGVCFEDLFISESGQGPHATALRACGHWFCDACWHAHLATTAREGVAMKPQCPEFQCHVEVDRGTLLTLLHVRDVMAQQRRQVEVAVTRRFLTKWCPNPRCGRVMQLSGHRSSAVLAEPTSLACPCGKRFCFRCHGDPHWPMSCDDLTEYHAQLRLNGDLDMTPVHLLTSKDAVVRGKSCPACDRFIVKEGGCPYMTCVCRYTFWWCCRKSTRKLHNCPHYIAMSDTTNTVKRVIKHVDKASHTRPDSDSQSPWYKLAVHHRITQHPKRARRDYRLAEELRRNLLTLVSKGVDIGVPHALTSKDDGGTAAAGALTHTDSDTRMKTHDDSRSSGLSGRATKQQSFVLSTGGGHQSLSTAVNHIRKHVKQTTVSMIKLKMEVHSVVENTAAVLSLRQQRPASQGPSPVTVKGMKDSVERLAFLATSLDLLLHAQGSQELRRVLPWFRRLQREVKDTLISLARVCSATGRH